MVFARTDSSSTPYITNTDLHRQTLAEQKDGRDARQLGNANGANDEDIRSMILMRGLGVSKDQRGSVLSLTQGKLEEKSVATALKQLYPDGTRGGRTLAYPHKKKKDKKLTDHQKAHKIYAAANEGVNDGWQYTTDQSGTFAASEAAAPEHRIGKVR